MESIYSQRSVAEWVFKTAKPYVNPFIDVMVDVEFTSPNGRVMLMPAFYAGDGDWKVRLNPAEAGDWQARVLSRPTNPDLDRTFRFSVLPAPQTPRGFLRSTPGKAWGFHYESGEPVFIFGDTVYNLFGMAHNEYDVAAFLQRRAAQGFNLLRVRLPVSRFHPPEGYSHWQTRSTFPWGGSEQAPRFDQFNLDYFKTVDQVVQQVEALGIGLEMIMEAWGFEFPFNSRAIFTAEWEELWMRYLIARYDAYNCVAMWTLMNEYEYYPNGEFRHKLVADRWAIRMARWVKHTAAHGHIVAVHNGPSQPPFAQRFAADPYAIDTILFQGWGSRDRLKGWLADGIEDQIDLALTGWYGSAIFAEWGYERNPQFDLLMPGHEYCDVSHTRRGAWRGAFCGLGIIHGFENSWGPWCRLDEDQPGMQHLLQVRRFFTDILPFRPLRRAPELLRSGRRWEAGARPMILAAHDLNALAVYLPVGGEVELALPGVALYQAEWFNPSSGDLTPANENGQTIYTSPAVMDSDGHPLDWVLVLRKKG